VVKQHDARPIRRRGRAGLLCIVIFLAVTGCSNNESVELALDIIETEAEIKDLEERFDQSATELEEALATRRELEDERDVLQSLNSRLADLSYPDGWLQLRGTDSEPDGESTEGITPAPTTDTTAPVEVRTLRGNRQYVLNGMECGQSKRLRFDEETETWSVSATDDGSEPIDIPFESQPPLPPTWSYANPRDVYVGLPRASINGFHLWQIFFMIDTSKVYNSKDFFPVASFFIAMNLDTCTFAPLATSTGALAEVWHYVAEADSCIGLLDTDTVNTQPNASLVCESAVRRPDGEPLVDWGTTKLLRAIPTSSVSWDTKILSVEGIGDW